MARAILTQDDAARITAAVAAAEGATSGEIRCVIADDAEPMRAVLIAGCVALALPAVGLLLGAWPLVVVDVLGGWSAAHGRSGEETASLALQAYVAVQAVVLVFAMMTALSPVPRWLTPKARRKAAVERAAAAQFSALGLTATRDRTGVLLYVSLAHRRAEVLADEGIYAKAPHQAWDEVIALLTQPLHRGAAADGFVAAVEKVGEILATHLPPRADDRNELSDQPILIR